MRRTLAAALGAVLLTTACGGGDELAGSPPPSTSSEEVCLDGSYEPVEEDTVVPREEACPQETASRSPEPSSSPGPSVGAALLTPQDAAQAEQESWRDGDEEPEAGPLLDPCDDRTFPLAQDVTASQEGSLSWQRQESGAVVRQEVFRYRSQAAAAQALTEYADRVQRCPRRPVPDDPNGSSTAFDVVGDPSEGRLLVRQTACNPACVEHFRSYLGVAQQGDLLTVLTYGQLVDGDPQQEAAAVLDVAVRVLTEAAAGG